MKTFFPYTKGYRQWILLGVACSVAEAVLELELPQAMSEIVDVGIANGDRTYILLTGLKMLVLALLALVVNLGMFQEFGRFVIEVKEQLTAYLVGNGIAFLVELALLFVVGCLVLCLNFYAPLAIGHSFARHKLLWSVVFFFAIQIVIQIIGGVFGLIALPHLWSVNFNFMTAAAAAHAMMWSSILVTAIYGAILYGVTLYMLRKRLNLE